MARPAEEAVLQTGAVETTYTRAGAGKPLLLLFPKGLGDELATALFTRLAERFKVVAPVTPEGGQSLSKWLREVIDGLGLEKPVVVAEETLVGGLLGFALVDPGRVGGVVAVCRDDADPASSVGMVQATQGLLVVAVDTAASLAESAATAASEITRFVDEC
jgi:pimeloyl-ACP methyl ester carboxylesterase